MNFYYYENGQKQGPITNEQLAALVRQGIIIPTSVLETDTGHRGEAGQIPGLFPATQPMQQVSMTPLKRNFGPGDYLWIIFAGYLIDPSNKAKVESMTPEQKSALFRWRLAVAIPFLLLGLLILAMMFL